ncbi:hypothetical protein KV580_05880 [Pseudomonas chlororaphis]|nr:hypothetical protein [Pseudomonas chlororaphis]
MTSIVLSPAIRSGETKAPHTLRPQKALALAMLIAAGVIGPLIATSSDAAPVCGLQVRRVCNTNVPIRRPGYSPAFSAGYSNGYNDGYQAGYVAGRNDYAAGYDTGYYYGFTAGYDTGYTANNPPYSRTHY